MYIATRVPFALGLLAALAAAAPTPYYYIDHVDELRAKGMSERDILARIHAKHPTPALLSSGSQSQSSLDTEGNVSPGSTVGTTTSSITDWLLDSADGWLGRKLGGGELEARRHPAWTYFWFKPKEEQ